MRVFTRHQVARKLGRRVSRGEFERLFARLVGIPVVVQSVSRGRPTGTVRITMIRHPLSPKSRRKHDCEHGGMGKRARYT